MSKSRLSSADNINMNLWEMYVVSDLQWFKIELNGRLVFVVLHLHNTEITNAELWIYVLTNRPTNFKELSPFWEAASCAAIQEFPNIL